MECQYPKRQKLTSQPVATTAISEVTKEGEEVVDDTTEVVDMTAENESDASVLYKWAIIVFKGHLEHIELYDSGVSCHISPFTSGKPTFYFIVLFHAFLCFLCFLKEKRNTMKSTCLLFTSNPMYFFLLLLLFYFFFWDFLGENLKFFFFFLLFFTFKKKKK